MNTQTQSEQPPQPVMTEPNLEIIVISIDIGNGEMDEIRVHQQDEPEQLAQAFCLKHNFSKQVQKVLQEQIQHHIDLILEQEVGSEQPLPEPQTETPRYYSIQTEQSPIEYSCQSIDQEHDRLYYEGLFKQKQAERENQLFKQKQHEELMKESTFKPRINDNQGQRIPNPEFFLLKKWEARNTKLKQKRNQKQQEELKDCTFTPSISKKSELIQLKKQPGNRFQKLFENARIREEKLKLKSEALQDLYRLRDLCPFTPILNTSTTKSTADKSLIQKPIEVLSQQQTFHPRIGRPPKQRLPIDIGSRLYSLSFLSPTKQEPVQLPQRPAASKNDQILKELKRKRFKELFDQLSVSGVISADSIQYNKLPVQIRTALQPLIDELVELDEHLDFEEFYESMELLMKILTPTEKNLVLMPSKSQKRPASCPKKPFKPQDSNSLYSRNFQKLQESKQRIQDMRAARVTAQMAECTFQPKIGQYKFKSDYYYY